MSGCELEALKSHRHSLLQEAGAAVGTSVVTGTGYEDIP